MGGGKMQLEAALKAVCQRHNLEEKAVLKALPWLKVSLEAK
jgi:hypothetical protein